MTKVKKVIYEDYDWTDVNYGCVQLTEFIEANDRFWSAAVLLNFDDGTEDGHNLFIPTQITGECKLCVATEAGAMINALCGKCISVVNMFKEDGEELGEFDLNEPGFPHLDEEVEENLVEKVARVLH